MIPVGPVTTLNRSIFYHRTKNVQGVVGDDFLCGHCGHVNVAGFRSFNNLEANPVYQVAPFCENNNYLPFAASDDRHTGPNADDPRSTT